MLGNLAEKLFDGFIFVLCFFSRDPSKIKPRMTRKQKNALKGLNPKQQRLLKMLWKEMLNFCMYRDAYARGYYDLNNQINLASERHQRAILECLKSEIPEDKIEIFRIQH